MKTLHALSVLVVLVAPSVVHAQQRALFGVDVEGGAEILLDSTDMPRFGAGGGGALDFELNALPALGLHGGAVLAGFASGPQSSVYIGGRLGARLHWGTFITDFPHDGWIEAHGTFGTSDGVARPGFDVGLGFAFHLAHDVRLGPFARFNWADDPLGNNPMWITLGLELQLWGDPRTDARDTDADGISDPQDECPTEPAGARPDPARPGCPARDTDGDSVLDAADLCPTVPAGAHADPTRRGCPLECAAGTVLTSAGCTAQDADGDGVSDGEDACPTSPQGSHADPTRRGCPDGDDDADGVFNHADQCPTQPQGLHPDPARPGCPLADRDGDSVLDHDDACPDQAGVASVDARRNGCPGTGALSDRGDRFDMQPVFFATRRDRILSRSQPMLRALADALLASPEIELVSIEGHTDDVGDDALNLDLSRRRAANVMAFLIQHGVPATRLDSYGFGETRPLITANTDDARATNRRVEFRIIRRNGRQVSELGH